MKCQWCQDDFKTMKIPAEPGVSMGWLCKTKQRNPLKGVMGE